MSPSQRSIELHDLPDRVRLFGEYDRNLSAIEEALDVSVQADGDWLRVSGPPEDVERAGGRALPETLVQTQRGRSVRPRTPGQRRFVEAVGSKPLTIGIGPAGTGKTYLAIVMAVRAMRNREVVRVILSRPAVEAGEKLGFLPGDLREKVDPYMRPLFDALNDLLGPAVVDKHIDRGTLEVAPLAYMRGRTLSDAFVILDEAQNASSDQIKMFLTRLGSASKMVVVGDETQIDLPSGERSGLRDAANRLSGLDDVAIVEFDEGDVVRHPLVAKIIRAYSTPRTK